MMPIRRIAACLVVMAGLYLAIDTVSRGQQASQPATQGKDSTMSERNGAITMHGKGLTLVGNEVKVGDAAPDFVAINNDMSTFKLSSLKGQTVLLSAVPSLDTPVCSRETRRFNEEAAKIEGVKIVTISMDLPFAQTRWCAAEGIKNVVTVSDHRDASFGQAYGLLIKELRLLARSAIVVDPQGKITYIELVKEVTQDPNYDAALAAAKKAQGK